jgi:hypothetical protein
MAWSSTSSSNSSNPNPVRNILIANHAGSNGEAITSLQLYPPYAKRSGSVRTDDPCHIALHPSGRCGCCLQQRQQYKKTPSQPALLLGVHQACLVETEIAAVVVCIAASP